MADRSPQRSALAERWIFGATYAALMAALMFVHLVPLSVMPGRIPGPDLMVAVTLAWILRRPRLLPTPLVAAVFLLADLMFLRPIGLYAALVVLAIEFLRAREASIREQTFAAEWVMVATMVLALTLVNRLVLAIFLVDQPAFPLAAVQFAGTVLAYPVVVFVLRLVFGIGKLTASEADARGRV